MYIVFSGSRAVVQFVGVSLMMKLSTGQLKRKQECDLRELGLISHFNNDISIFIQQ